MIIKVWLKSSELSLNRVYTHVEVSSFSEVQCSLKLIDPNQRRNLTSNGTVQIMHFLRIFSGIYVQLSWQAVSWLPLTCLDMFLQVV